MGVKMQQDRWPFHMVRNAPAGTGRPDLFRLTYLLEEEREVREFRPRRSETCHWLYVFVLTNKQNLIELLRCWYLRVFLNRSFLLF